MRKLVRPARASAALIALLVGLLPGCRARPAPQDGTAYDLAALLELARVRSETGLVDLGTADARAFLEEGWSWNETDGSTSFVWGVGERSTARFFLTAARDLPIVLRGAAEPGPAGEPQTVTVVVNGRRLGDLELRPAFAEHRLELPAESVRPGWNRLKLRYSHRRPGPRIRQLAARWDWIRFADGGESLDPPRLGPRGEKLHLPPGTQVEYTLRLPARATLGIDELLVNGGGEAELVVLLAAEGSKQRVLATLTPGGGLRLELGEEPAGVAKLTLRAVSGGQAAEFVLTRPRIDLPSDGVAAPAVPRPNVILYLIDALRADRVGAYGAAGGLTPNIDRLAAEGLIWEEAIAQSSWTKPAVVSLFTGLLPVSHGVLLRGHALSERATTLAEVLLAAGYRTAAFSTNPFVSRSFGLDQGFLDFVYLDAGRAGTHHAFSDQVHEEVIGWLDRVDERPFLLYVHTVDPHAPYTPPRADGTLGGGEEPVPVPSCRPQRPLSERARLEMIRRYEEEIAFNDASFGRLVQALRERDLYDDSLVVLLSDHGEAFWEHRGWQHENFLYSEVLNVPLIVKPPRGVEATAADGVAQQIDVLPTVLDLLRLPPPAAVQGRSLVAKVGASEPRAGFAYLECPSGKRLEAVLAGPWKLIRTAAPDGTTTRLELFHRRQDPGELRDVAEDEPQVVERLLRLLQARGADQPLAGEPVEVGEELREALRALGYVD